MSSPFGSPLSQLDLLFAHPFLIAMRDRPGAPPSEAHPPTPSPRAAGSRRPSARRALARLQLAFAVLRHDLASFRASGPAQSDDEFRCVLMFALTGLALSLFLAAKAHAAGIDEVLASILLLSS